MSSENKVVLKKISFTSNGVLAGSVTGGDGDPLGPVVNPKGGGFVILERRSD